MRSKDRSHNKKRQEEDCSLQPNHPMKRKHTPSKPDSVRSPLRFRFMLLYFCFIFFPLMGLTTLFLANTSRHLEQALDSGNESSFQQTAQLLEYFLSNVNNSMNQLLALEEFHQVLEQNNDERSTLQQIEDMMYLQSLSASYRSQEEISDIHLYVNNQALYIGSSSWVQSMNEIMDTAWYSYASSHFPKATLIPSHFLEQAGSIGYAKEIHNSKNYQEVIGILRFDIQSARLQRMLGTDEDSEALTLIINQEGEEICHADNQLTRQLLLSLPATSLETADTASSLNASALPFQEITEFCDGSSHHVEWQGGTYLLYSTLLSGTDWYLVCLVPYDQLWENLISQNWFYLLALFLLAVFGFGFAYLFTKLFLNRISTITRHMSKIQTCLPPPLPQKQTHDEIDALVSAYNYMLTRLDSMMKEQYALGNQIKEAEMKALYEQINPHFLYNTLAMINWLAEDGQVEDVSRVIAALSRFYRLSLNKGNENIYLREELNIIESFVYIQQMRIGTSIQLILEADEIYLDFVLPKLTLQPLVENALVHGILMKRDKSGVIRIQVSEEIEDSHCLVICIRDDGIGIEADTLAQLNNGSLQSSSKHYGIRNVQQRLTLYYGQPCSLQYESISGQGTSVTLKLPYA